MLLDDLPSHQLETLNFTELREVLSEILLGASSRQILEVKVVLEHGALVSFCDLLNLRLSLALLECLSDVESVLAIEL